MARASTVAETPTRAKVFVGVALALLLVPGVIGFDLWPLTGWRMYSLANTATRVDWRVEAETPTGPVDVEWAELPLAYRLAAWPLADLADASREHRDEVCRALLVGVREAFPGTTRLTLVRDRRRLAGDEPVLVDRERISECGAA